MSSFMLFIDTKYYIANNESAQASAGRFTGQVNVTPDEYKLH